MWKQSVIFSLVMGVIGAALAVGVISVNEDRFVQMTNWQLGNVVGVGGKVEENKYNKLAQELEEYKQELDLREEALRNEEILITDTRETNTDVAVVFMATIGGLLLILILLNFYMDWKRGKRIDNAQNKP